MSGEPLFATTDDGARIAVHEVAREGRHPQAVFLTHGTFSDVRVCWRLARAIAQRGFASYVMEWRGHGSSGLGREAPSFECVARRDVPAALALVRARSGKDRVLWVGHSGGGLLAWMHLARGHEGGPQIDGVVSLASQACGVGATILGRVVIALGAIVTRLLGRTPGRALGLGPEDEPASVMNEWYRWNWRGRWRAPDGFDYGDALRTLRPPALVLAGGGDRFIAPPRACRALYEALGSMDKELVVCSRSEGFAEDYDHARILASRGSMREIWPRIIDWLLARARASSGDSSQAEAQAHAPPATS